MLSQTNVKEALKSILSGVELSEENQALMEQVTIAVAERDNLLKEFGTLADDGVFTKNPPEETVWESKYKELHGQYLDRFFTKTGDKITANAPPEPEPEPVTEPEVKSIDSLIGVTE